MDHPFGTNVLITGASSGIGLSTAKLLASCGFEVYGVSRRGDGPADAHIHWHSLDVTDDAMVASSIPLLDREAVRETGNHLSIVIHAAGGGIAGSAERMPDKDARRQFDVNYFGVLSVNRAILPILRQRKSSLVVLMSSMGGRIPLPYQSHYSSSKFALEAYGEALRMEAKEFGVHVCLVEPGDTKTAFTKNRQTEEDTESPYYAHTRKAVEKIAHDEQGGDAPTSVAKAILHIATHQNTPVRKPIGLDSKMENILVRILPSTLVEALLRKIYII